VLFQSSENGIFGTCLARLPAERAQSAGSDAAIGDEESAADVLPVKLGAFAVPCLFYFKVL